MLRFACFSMIITLIVGLEFQAKITNQWQKFKFTHGKQYTGEEEVKRREIFKKNVEEILMHNLRSDLGEFSYKEGINEFSDMEHEEFVKTMCGGFGSLNDTIGNEVMVPTPQVKAPASVDWRDLGAVTPIKNQGGCGSCWAFGAVGTIEGAWFKKNNELIPLSEQHILDCASNRKYQNQGCNGGWTDKALKYVVDNGGVNEDSCYKYQAKVGKCAFDRNCKTIKITKFVTVPRGNENALLEAVANNGPLSVDINASNRDFMSYRSGVYLPSICGSSDKQLDHVVTLVGYGAENGLDYWLLKNSWGTSWGERGYMKLARNKKNLCGVATGALYAVA